MLHGLQNEVRALPVHEVASWFSINTEVFEAIGHDRRHVGFFDLSVRPVNEVRLFDACLLYTSPSPRDS